MSDKKNAPTSEFAGRSRSYWYNKILVGSKTGESLMAWYNEGDSQTKVVIKRPDLRRENIQLVLRDLEHERDALGKVAVQIVVQKAWRSVEESPLCRLIESGEKEAGGRRYVYLVIEHAGGKSLTDWAAEFQEKGEFIPEGIWLPAMVALIRLLDVAHKAGVIYNDVKADHLFFDEATGRVKVIDWGNAVATGEMNAITPKTDVYQFGELLHWLATERLFNSREVEADFKTNPMSWERHIGLSPTGPLFRILRSCLHPQAGQRAEAAQIWEALNAYWLEQRAMLVELQEQGQIALAAVPPRLEEARARIRDIAAYDPYDSKVGALTKDYQRYQLEADAQAVMALIEEKRWQDAFDRMGVCLDFQGKERLFQIAAIVMNALQDPSADPEFPERASAFARLYLAKNEKEARSLLVKTGWTIRITSPDNALLGLLECEENELIALSGKLVQKWQPIEQWFEHELQSTKSEERKRTLVNFEAPMSGALRDLKDRILEMYNRSGDGKDSFLMAEPFKRVIDIYDGLNPILDRIKNNLWSIRGGLGEALSKELRDIFEKVQAAAQTLRRAAQELYDEFNKICMPDWNEQQFRHQLSKCQDLDPHNPSFTSGQALNVNSIRSAAEWRTRLLDPFVFKIRLNEALKTIEKLHEKYPEQEQLCQDSSQLEVLKTLWNSMRPSDSESPTRIRREAVENKLEKEKLPEEIQKVVLSLYDQPWLYSDNEYLALALTEIGIELEKALLQEDGLVEKLAAAEVHVHSGDDQAWYRDFERLVRARRHTLKADPEKSEVALKEVKRFRETPIGTFEETINRAQKALKDGKSELCSTILSAYAERNSLPLLGKLRNHSNALPGLKKFCNQFDNAPLNLMNALTQSDALDWYQKWERDLLGYQKTLDEVRNALNERGDFFHANDSYSQLMKSPKTQFLGETLKPEKAFKEGQNSCSNAVNLLRDFPTKAPPFSEGVRANFSSLYHFACKALGISQLSVLAAPAIWWNDFNAWKILFERNQFEDLRAALSERKQSQYFGRYPQAVQAWYASVEQNLTSSPAPARPTTGEEGGERPGRNPWLTVLALIIIVIGVVALAVLAIRIMQAQSGEVQPVAPSPWLTATSSLTPTPLVTLCGRLEAARAGKSWEEIEALTKTEGSSTTCPNGRTVGQYYDEALLNLGQKNYDQGKYQKAIDYWQKLSLNDQSEKIAVLIACAQARKANTNAAIQVYPADTVRELCRFDPASLAPLPTFTPTLTPTLTATLVPTRTRTRTITPTPAMPPTQTLTPSPGDKEPLVGTDLLPGVNKSSERKIYAVDGLPFSGFSFAFYKDAPLLTVELPSEARSGVVMGFKTNVFPVGGKFGFQIKTDNSKENAISFQSISQNEIQFTSDLCSPVRERSTFARPDAMIMKFGFQVKDHFLSVFVNGEKICYGRFEGEVTSLSLYIRKAQGGALSFEEQTWLLIYDLNAYK